MLIENNKSPNDTALSRGMLKRGFSMIQSHFSLAVIIGGAVCFLLTNIILRELLDEHHYGVYSIVITFLSATFIYGLLGFEQVFVRFSHQKGAYTITTQKTQLKYGLLIVLLTTVLSVVAYENYFTDYLHINILLLSGATFSMISTMILFNIFRLNQNFVASQFVSNGWKIIMALVALFFFAYKMTDLALFINIVLSAIIVIAFISFVIILNKFSWEFNDELSPKNTQIAFFNFFIAITAFSIVLFADRFIIESKLGTRIFGDYFYLTTLVLSPFSILQNYVGFKQLIGFKQKFTITSFKHFNKKIIVFSFGLAFAMVLFIMTLSRLNFLNFDFGFYTTTIGLLLVLGIVRLYSSAVLSAFEAKTSIKTLQTANLIVVSTTIIVSIFVIYTSSTLDQIISGFILIWFFRSLIYRQLLVRQITRVAN